MGVKDLRTFLKNKNVNCFYTIPLLSFYEKRMAIDSLNWVFCYLGSAFKNIMNYKKDILDHISQEEIYDKMIEEFLNFNIKLMSHGITPVWIWDGVSQDNKQVTKVERRKSKQQMIEKRDNIIKILKEMNPLERPFELIKELKQLMINTIHFKRENIERIKKFSEEIGICTITADDEAESLGASLAVERIVGAIWSADTDTYPIGSPIVAKGFENIGGEAHINVVYTLNILRDLKLTHEEFRDFCIMLGTDFNDRLPGIGPAKSFKLIEKYRNLETIEKETSHNFYSMKYVGIRGQMAAYDTPYNGINDLMTNQEVNFEELKEKYEKYSKFVKMMECIENLPKPKNIAKNY